jgi:hypothetical protein
MRLTWRRIKGRPAAGGLYFWGLIFSGQMDRNQRLMSALGKKI